MGGPSWHDGEASFLRPAGRPGVSWILEGRLLVGEHPTPDDAAWLRQEYGVAAVVSLQDDADLAAKRLDLEALRHAYRRARIEFHHLPVPDGAIEALAARLPDIVARLHALLSTGCRVYLHCNAGFNRAPTAAIAYLHVHERLPLRAAEEAVKQRRACVPYRRALELFVAR